MTLPKAETISTHTISPKRLKRLFSRERFAYAGFTASILLVGIGAGLYHPGAGFIASGLMLAAFSWLLGDER